MPLIQLSNPWRMYKIPFANPICVERWISADTRNEILIELELEGCSKIHYRIRRMKHSTVKSQVDSLEIGCGTSKLSRMYYIRWDREELKCSSQINNTSNISSLEPNGLNHSEMWTGSQFFFFFFVKIDGKLVSRYKCSTRNCHFFLETFTAYWRCFVI